MPAIYVMVEKKKNHCLPDEKALAKNTLFL